MKGKTITNNQTGEKMRMTEQDGYFLIICNRCNHFVKGTSEKHVLANITTHQKSSYCKETEKAKKTLSGDDSLPKLYGTKKEKLEWLELYKNSWFYEEMKGDLEKEKEIITPSQRLRKREEAEKAKDEEKKK